MRDGIASLPWYDLRETRRETDRLWARVAAALWDRGVAGVPSRLDRETPLERQWRSPRFLFGQCCGYDVVRSHAGCLEVVAAPTYVGARAGPGRYRSLVLVSGRSRATCLADLRGVRCAVNDPNSHSGMNVLRALVAPLHVGGRFFGSVALTGSHERSVEALRRGEADVAAVDAVVHALLLRHRPSALAGLRILLETPSAPAPPFVTRARPDPAGRESLRSALGEALLDPDLAADREALLLVGSEPIPGEAYGAIATQEDEAQAAGYSLLADSAAASARSPARPARGLTAGRARRS